MKPFLPSQALPINRCNVHRRIVWIWLSLLSLAGCGRFDTTYGPSDGFAGSQSLNGFGAFRDSLELTDQPGLENAPEIETRNVMRLSSRSFRSDAIVWVPAVWPVANLPEVTGWMNTWLSSGDKTLVVVVPDDGSAGAYWREATKLAPPEQRLEYRRRIARQINDRWLRDADRDDFVLSDWFRAVPLPYEIDLSDRQRISFNLQPFKLPNTKVSSPSLKNIAKSQEEQIDAPEDLDEIQWLPLHVESLPQSAPVSEVTTLAELTRKSWNGSRVIVVSSGALVTNYAMTGESARRLARDVANQIRGGMTNQSDGDDSLDVGFMETDELPLAVSNASPSAPVSSGMELLTTWPLSLVTIHLLFFGVVLCIMLLPGFGRPRSVRYNQPTRFANHLDAMAALMQRAGAKQTLGQQFARQRISHYLRTVRGETNGPWVIDDAQASQTSTTTPS